MASYYILNERTMIKIGSVCPLFFNPLKDPFSTDIPYIQRFHASDKILIQILCDNGETPSATLRDEVSRISTPINASTHVINSSIKLYYFTLSNLQDSIYSVNIDGVGHSELFSVDSSDDLLESTSLIKYSHKDNNSIDNIFWIGDQQQVFEIRYECGFKPSGIKLKADVEQFRNQNQEIVPLYAIPYKTMEFIAGNAIGLPYWFGEHLNRILCLSDVRINDVGYVRSEGSEPEMTAVMENSQMFFVSVVLEPMVNNVHGIGGVVQPPSGSVSSAGLIIINPKDGEVPVYSEKDGAFVNSDRL